MKTVAAGIAFAALFNVLCAQEVVRRTFSGAKSIEVDNVFGSIHVTGSSGPELEIVARRSVVADTPERADAANREVKLELTQSGGDVRAYVDGPFRCHCDDGPGMRGRNNMNERGRRGYKVIYEFDIKAPRGTAMYLSAINEGQIRVERTSGDFDIDNINGGVEMDDVEGSGRVYALNGNVVVKFARNPERTSYFGSLNGLVETWFQPDFSADVRVKTFNGGIYTDFPVSYLPATAATPERRNGRFLYRSSGFQGIRVGKGGPELKFENFNGDIRIRNRGQS